MSEAMLTTTPVFRVFNREQAIEFYVAYLGFTVDWERQFDPSAPLCIQVSRGDLTIHLAVYDNNGCPGSEIYVEMIGLDDFHRELKSRNEHNFNSRIEPMPWGSESDGNHRPVRQSSPIRRRYAQALKATSFRRRFGRDAPRDGSPSPTYGASGDFQPVLAQPRKPAWVSEPLQALW